MEEMRQASMALMELIPTEPTEVQEGRDLGRDGRGRDRDSDDEQAAATASWLSAGVKLSGFRPEIGRTSEIRTNPGQPRP